MNPLQGVSWTRSRSTPGVEILSAIDNMHPWRIFHERYEVCVISRLQGPVYGRYRGRLVSIQAPGLILMEPGEMHSTSTVTGGVDLDVLIISPEIFLHSAEEQGLTGQVHFGTAQSTDWRLSASIHKFAASIKAGATPLEQQSRLAYCLQGMQAHAEKKPRASVRQGSTTAIRLAMECLRERYRDPVDLEELSALTGLSRFALVHAFSNQVGIPPHAYQIRVRVERARALLMKGIPASSVAAELGFADQSHLQRHFKNIMQITPGGYLGPVQRAGSSRR